MDNVSAALDYVIGAMMFGEFKPSEEQLQRLREVLPELTPTSSKEQRDEQRRQLHARMWTLKLEGITIKNREESIKRVKGVIAKIVALEADSEAVGLLSSYFRSDASIELRQAREKAEKLLHQLESGETFATKGAVVSINTHIRRLIMSLRGRSS